MAAIAQMPKAAIALLLGGTYDVESASLGVALLEEAWGAPDLNDDALIFDDSDAHVLDTIVIPSQSWAWDDDLRTRTLVVGSSITWTPAGAEDFKYVVIYDVANDKPPLSVIAFPSAQTASGSTLHTLQLDPLLTVALWSSSDPYPIGNVESPVVLTDIDETSWRVNAIGGVLGALTTSEVDERQTFLTSPDLTQWLLHVSTGGVVTAVAGTFASGDRLFDSTHPCILPSDDVDVQYVLSVSNAGVLSVA